jgi:glutathione synthase
MKMGVLVNDLESETPFYSTTALVRAARQRGHEVWMLGTDDFVYEDDRIRAWAVKVPNPAGTAHEFLRDVRAIEPDGSFELETLDVLLLRNNPVDDLYDRPWASSIGLVFGEAARDRGVLVLNDPSGLARASSKLYLEQFPREMRPVSLVTRHAEDIVAFVAEHGEAVIKPIHGSGGRGVFIVREKERENFNQIVDAVREYGYVIAQEYLPAAREGDVRLMLVDGEILEHEGKAAAMRRIGKNGDVRNNLHAGGRFEAVEIDDAMRQLAALAKPNLLRDGMWMVGLDVVGDKVLEINVFSPGGLVAPKELHNIDFASLAIAKLEDRVENRGEPRSSAA